MGSGSNLIPITDSSIAVQKEILKITRVENDFVEVDVYYEFYNDGDAKEMLIGFEAMSPFGDVSTLPINGRHPYISNFTVIVNGESIAYKVAKVRGSVYYTNGVFNEIAKDDYELSYNIQHVDFLYVYHFNCKMEAGLNVIKHSYKQKMSSSVVQSYSFDYVLTAANRWKDGVIKDFTLKIDMGENQRLSIRKSFFLKLDYWTIDGVGEVLDKHSFHYIEDDWLPILMSKGKLIFQQLNFRPTGELHFSSFREWANPLEFDSENWSLPSSFDLISLYPKPKNKISEQIIKNAPFALRGYIFKTQYIQEYYEKQKWYIRNAGYEATLESLSNEEKEWVLNWIP
jgi:hypothetical protein